MFISSVLLSQLQIIDSLKTELTLASQSINLSGLSLSLSCNNNLDGIITFILYINTNTLSPNFLSECSLKELLPSKSACYVYNLYH